MGSIRTLPYIDIQHDAQAVFDDVEQGIVVREDIWVSAYKVGEPSVHGKVCVEARDGGGVDMVARDGVEIERVSKTNFDLSAPALNIVNASVRFPRQVVRPPFTKPTPVSQEQHINSVAYSDKAGQLLIGGPDGYAVVLSPSDPSSALELKGHVGDVLHVSWFPSGEVVLTASSDLTLRIFSSKTGINPRTLKGHTRAITSTAILGVGKQVLSASKDGTLRVWDVGAGTEARRWAVGGSVEALVVVEDEVGLAALGQGAGQRVALAATPEGSISAYVLESESAAPLFTVSPAVSSSKLLSIAYDPASQLVASGHADGKIVLRRLAALAGDNSDAVVVRRNVAPIFSLAFAGTDLLVGTGSGLPCRLAIDADLNATVKEEYAGWEAVAIESWAVAPDGVWCAGGEKSVRRY